MIISVFDKSSETLWEKKKLLVQAISPFPIMFSKASFPGASKGVIVWEWVKQKVKVTGILSFSHLFYNPSRYHMPHFEPNLICYLHLPS